MLLTFAGDFHMSMSDTVQVEAKLVRPGEKLMRKVDFIFFNDDQF